MLTNTAINDNKETLRSDNDNPGISTANTSAMELTPRNLSSTINLKITCYANICRLLRARGIIRHQMTCRNGHNFCSGCEIELAKHRKVFLLEYDMLALSLNNDTLAPLLEYRSKPISIKQFWNTLSCLHTFMNKSRDDYIFGAARYLANTLGIFMPESLSSNLIDTPLTSTELKQLWRKATFFCRCQGNILTVSYDVRSFCRSCSCLVPLMNSTSAVKCPGCQSYDSWEHIGFPCLSCQFANIVLRNPFGRRFQILLDTWLPIPSDSDCSSIDTNYVITNTAKNWDTSYETQHPSYKKLAKLRCQAINDSLNMIQSQSSIEENRSVFMELALLRKNITNQVLLDSQHSELPHDKTDSEDLRHSEESTDGKEAKRSRTTSNDTIAKLSLQDCH